MAGDWKDSLTELSSLELKIKNLTPKRKPHLNVNELLRFDEQRVYETVKSAIKLNSSAVSPDGEDFLLYEYGKFEIDTGKHLQLRFEWPIPPGSAIFQINRKLYVCGGEAEFGATKVCLDEFFWGDYEGKC